MFELFAGDGFRCSSALCLFLYIFGKNVGKFHSVLRVRGLFSQKLTTEPKSYSYRLTILTISSQYLQNCNFENYCALFFIHFW